MHLSFQLVVLFSILKNGVFFSVSICVYDSSSDWLSDTPDPRRIQFTCQKVANLNAIPILQSFMSESKAAKDYSRGSYKQARNLGRGRERESREQRMKSWIINL
jgi:hypothetical protein